jgi:DNA-binding NarL/FixJ family response regulator
VIAVLLATADAPTRSGIVLALERSGLQLCAEAADAASAVERAHASRADVCLVDKTLPGGGVETVRALRRALPNIKLIVLSRDEGQDEEMLDAIVAGASGYLTTDVDPERLEWIVRGVHAGEAVLSRRMTHRLLEALRSRRRGRDLPVRPGAGALTEREVEVLELLAGDLSTSEVAQRLAISETTVRRHVSGAVD